MQKLVFFKRFMLVFVILVATIQVTTLTLENAVPARELPEQNQPVATPLYIVKSEENRVGVYKGSGTSPEYYIDVLTENLPQRDRELLKIGIEIYTEEELVRIMEDLES